MNQQTRVLLAVLTGATIGGLAGYLLLTDSGRRIREQIEPTLDDIMREVARLGGTVNRIRSATSDGWRLLNEVAGETGAAASWNAPIRQQSPF